MVELWQEAPDPPGDDRGTVPRDWRPLIEGELWQLEGVLVRHPRSSWTASNKVTCSGWVLGRKSATALQGHPTCSSCPRGRISPDLLMAAVDQRCQPSWGWRMTHFCLVFNQR